MKFVLPDGYSNFPIQLKGMFQFARHLSLIGGEGYNTQFENVWVDRHDYENMAFPGVNVWWDSEKTDNAAMNDNTPGVYSVRVPVYLDVLFEDEYPSIKAGLIKADIEKYFLSKTNKCDCLPEADGAATVQSMMIAGMNCVTDAQHAHRARMQIECRVWYKTKMGDPYTRP